MKDVAPEAFHGWLGRWVKALEPVAEADPVALLGLGLGALGHCVREVVSVPGGHPLNQLMVLVGDERAGGGIAWGHVYRLFSTVSENWDRGVITKMPPHKYWASLAGVWDQGKGSFLSRSRPEEVLDRLAHPEATYSGLASRTLLLRLRRSSPRPLADVEGVLFDTAYELRESLDFAEQLIHSRLRLAPEMAELWGEVYSSLSAPRKSGYMVNVMTELAERHVLRLAGLYAVVDRSPEIRPDHLLAALAIWDHHEETLRELFGDQTGNKKQDAILRSLRERHPAGMTSQEINRMVLQGNSRGGAEPILRELEQEGLISSTEEPASGCGRRPAHRWFLAQALDDGMKHSYLGIAHAIMRKTVELGREGPNPEPKRSQLVRIEQKQLPTELLSYNTFPENRTYVRDVSGIVSGQDNESSSRG